MSTKELERLHWMGQLVERRATQREAAKALGLTGAAGSADSGRVRGARRRGAYQALFSYLAEPELLEKPLRMVASEAGVSTSPVLQVRQKLLQQRWIAKSAAGYAWTPPGKRDAREFWLRGYQSTLRPSLLIQRYRPRTAQTAKDLAKETSHALTGRVPFRWGGAPRLPCGSMAGTQAIAWRFTSKATCPRPCFTRRCA